MRVMHQIWLVVFASFALATPQNCGWRELARAPGTSEIELHVALKPATPSRHAEQIALQIADPLHRNFRLHLTSNQASSLTDPSLESREAVAAWLRQHDVSASFQGGMLVASTTIAAAERLLNATYNIYRSGEESVIRALDVNLPPHVAEHIDFITPSNQFPSCPLRKLRRRQVASSTDLRSSLGLKATRDSCGSSDQVTPACIKQVYNITYTAKPNRTTFAVYGTEAASFSASNLHNYLEQYNQPAASAGATYQVVGSGDPAEGSGGLEGNFESALDTQTLLGSAWPAQGIYYNYGGVFGPSSTKGKTYDRFVSFLQELINNDTVPSVVSTSESMPEDMMDPAYAQRLCTMMAQVGTRGVSLLFSSGDNGANGDTPDGKHEKVFEPEFPASCPFVTSVGGTTNMANEMGATEQTMRGGGLGYWASGGGFSALFARPSYQDNTVPAYISQNVPSSYSNETGYNASGRGIPDVSAFSTNVPATVGVLSIGIGGTSASTPIWGAIITLLNDYQASQGRPPLGFLNPWLYQLRSGLKDITEGGNNAGSCNLVTGCTLSHTLGYNVTTGWDAVTGLGSPNFGLLLEALRQNGSSTASISASSSGLPSTSTPPTSTSGSGLSSSSTSSSAPTSTPSQSSSATAKTVEWSMLTTLIVSCILTL